MRPVPALLILACLGTPAFAADAPAVHARLLKSTAWVRTTTQGVGTGWVVDARRRWLVTNLHVVGEQDRVEAFFVARRDGRPISERLYYLENQKQLHEQGRAVRGKVILRREASDLALVELEKLPPGIEELPLAARLPGPGERVHSAGNRLDADALWLYAAGEVRQIGLLADGYFWRGKKLAADAPCLIVQAPIHPGDSGGALVNDRSEVVGVVSGGRWRAPLAAIAIQVGEVHALLAEAAKADRPAEKEEQPSGTELFKQLVAASVWVRPTATEGRAAGWIVDRERRLILTTATGAGAFDLVDVVFPIVAGGRFAGEAGAYADHIGLRQTSQLVRGVVLARDPKRDLALIELETLPAHAKSLMLAKKEPAPAEKVHALSHPSGVEFLWLYSSGSVRQIANVELISTLSGESAKPRSLLLQIPHQGGSAGGPVVNDRGELVGMLAAKEAAQQQLGYALAAAELKAFLESARPLFAPKTGSEYHQRGLYLLARGRSAAAVAAARKAVELEPTSQAALRDLVDALLRSGHTDQVNAMLRKLDPNVVETLACTALAHLLMGRHEEAKVWCERVLKKDRKNAVGYLVCGALNDGKDAIADLDEAIFLDASMVEAYRRRAAAHEKKGDDERALADLSRAVELDPYEPETIRRRAVLYLKKNEPKRAAADYERLIELLPADAASQRGLAGAWLAQGDEAKAIPALVAMLRWQPATVKDALADILAHGADLAKRWPDDPMKRVAWYTQALTAMRGALKDVALRKRIDDTLSGEPKDGDAQKWGDELEKRMRTLVR